VALGRDSSGTQEGEPLPLEGCTRGLVGVSRPRGLSVCVWSEMQTVRNRDRLGEIVIALYIYTVNCENW
jgi:hypothetical protein